MVKETSHQEFFKNVLLVEDEIPFAEAMKIALKKLPIRELWHAPNLELARKKIKSHPIDLIILDRNLPDGDGLSFCQEVREAGFNGMILFLTALGDIEDRIAGLNVGADEYLPKPFSWDELLARLMALNRRINRNTTSIPKKGSASILSTTLWTLDQERLRILGLKGWVTLTPLEFKLALHLIQAQGAIVHREELLKEVWGFRFLPKTRTVDYFMGRLRKHFESNPDVPQHFLTVRGAGYRFTSIPESNPSD
jgi:DNA-binding response OmpR family regulator